MEKLKLDDGGTEKTIYADTKVDKGIYIADEPKAVKKNIETRKISFEPVQGYVAQHKISKVGTWSSLLQK